MGCEDFLVHGRVSMLIFCLTYALFFNKIGYLCRGGSLSPSYTRILALHLYSLFFPILTSRIVYLSSSNSGHDTQQNHESHRCASRQASASGVNAGGRIHTVPLLRLIDMTGGDYGHGFTRYPCPPL